jgi:hypothetical protein
MRDTEPWCQLLQLAAIEDDPYKVLALVKEIKSLLKEHDHLVTAQGPASRFT